MIVALVTEGLHRPARVVTTVRDSRTGRFDPVAEGRRGMREGDLERARPARPGEPASTAPGPDGAPARAPRERPAKSVSPARAAAVRRRRIMLAVATGLIAFVIAGVVVTGTELVFGNSAVSGASKRTTFLGGSHSKSRTTDEEKTTSTDEETTPTTSTETTETTTTGTETQPGVVPTTQSAPAQTAPAPTTTSSPGGTPAPPTTAAPAAPPPATP